MSCKLVTHYTKPDSVKWFAQVSQDNFLVLSRLGKTVRNFPGVQTLLTSFLSPTQTETVIIFDTRANCDAYLVNIANDPDFQTRQAFFDANRITTEQTIVDL